jgi:hypothetical protein
MACNFALVVAAIDSLVALFYSVRMARKMNQRESELRETLNASIAQGGANSADDVRRFLADRRKKD